MDKRIILIVDDNIVNRKILCKILGKDYSVLEAENGEIALSVLRENYEIISVVLLDIVMPVLDGYAVLGQMRKDPNLSKIPVIVASGQSDLESEEKALSLGANDYIIKPYQPTIIKHRIANTIYFRETASFVNAVQKDALTGVYSKEYFYLRAEEILRKHTDKKYDIICCDIEHFKLVNELYGTKTGNELLQYVADVISKAIDDQGICGRIGADVFAFLLEHRIEYVPEHFSAIINEINRFPIKFSIMLRYGIYRIDAFDAPVSIMCDRACLAKKAIKGKYNTFFAYYDDKLQKKLLDEQSIVSDMKTALQENQFQVFFQPKYDLKTQEVAGAEALVRWFHPVKGFLPPSAFVPIFERNGFIADLDYYIWEQCCRKMRAWADLGNIVIPISINVSRVDIYDAELPEKLVSLVQKYKLSPKDLHLEITESAYTENPEQLIAMVSQIKKIGFVIEMDDFGTGYSSLNMLSELPIDILKLDMRFIQKEEKKSRDRSILSFIISLAKWMDLQVVAEGIETAEQVQLLQSLNCEYAQGYYFAKPMPQEQFEQHLLTAKVKMSHSPHIEMAAGSQAEHKRLKTLLLIDRNGMDYPLLLREYENRYLVERVETPAQALAALEEGSKEVCAVALSLPDSIESERMTQLVQACKKYNIPVLVIYDQGDSSAEPIISMDISDYTARPYEFRQLNRRLQNAIAYAKMERFEQEKEINAAIIEMRRRAERDALTGLLNRAELELRLDRFFFDNRDPKGIFIILDVDNFKEVNDTFGHVVGDAVINAIGAHLKKVFPETEIVARIGGDEFALFLPYMISSVNLQEKMNRICSRFSLSVENIEVCCSAGICYCPEYGIDYKELYKNADMALIFAKRHGKGRFEIFTPKMELLPPSVFREKTLQMLDQVSDAMFVSDAVTSEIIYINESACNAVEKSKAECFGKRCYELFWDQCHHCDRCEYITEKGFYEESSFLKDHVTPVRIKARLERWEGRSVKVHYLTVGFRELHPAPAPHFSATI